MKASKTVPKDIDEYIAGFPKEVQERLKEIRAAIRKAAPDAKEMIKYEMPTYNMVHGNMAYFAAYKKHIAFYPAPRETEEFKEELAAYPGGKGTVQFPLDKPIPSALIERMVEFNVRKYSAIAETKKGKAKAS